MYKIRCFEESSRCTSDVTPSRLIYKRAKKLLSSISSVGRVTIAWDAWEVPLASSLDSYTSNWRRILGTFTVLNFVSDVIFSIFQQHWGGGGGGGGGGKAGGGGGGGEKERVGE